MVYYSNLFIIGFVLVKKHMGRLLLLHTKTIMIINNLEEHPIGCFSSTKVNLEKLFMKSRDINFDNNLVMEELFSTGTILLDRSHYVYRTKFNVYH